MSRSGTGEAPHLEVVFLREFFGTLRTLIGRVFDHRVIMAALVCMTVIYVVFLLARPDDAPSPEQIGKLVEAILSSSAPLAWLLLIIALMVSIPTVQILLKRVKTLGQQVSELQSKEDPKRLSSTSGDDLFERATMDREALLSTLKEDDE